MAMKWCSLVSYRGYIWVEPSISVFLCKHVLISCTCILACVRSFTCGSLNMTLRKVLYVYLLTVIWIDPDWSRFMRAAQEYLSAVKRRQVAFFRHVLEDDTILQGPGWERTETRMKQYKSWFNSMKDWIEMALLDLLLTAANGWFSLVSFV